MQFLIVNAGCTHFGHGGTLSAAMVDKARETLEKLGHTVEETRLENGWDNAEEAQKILRADVVIIQTPGWWMSTPWQLKKYEDDVFVDPILCGGDGRRRQGTKNREVATAEAARIRRRSTVRAESSPRSATFSPRPGMRLLKPSPIPTSSSKAKASTASSCRFTRPSNFSE